MRALLLLALPVLLAATTVTEQPSTSWSVYRSTTVIATVGSEADCKARALQDAATRAPGSYSYGCQKGRDRLTVTVSADVPPPPPPPPPSGDDFAALCAQPGVVKCVDFDQSSDLSGKLVEGNGAAPTIDTSVKASGAGSMRMTYAPGGAQSTGGYRDTLGASFGNGQTMYVAYKLRLSPGLLTGAGGGNGWKTSIFYGSKSCGSMEITAQNNFHRGFPQMYGQCGSQNYRIAVGSDWRLQMGAGLDCRYNNQGGCLKYVADKWMTFYFAIGPISIGGNTPVKAYMAVDGGAFRQWMDFPARLSSDGVSSLQNLQLTMYTTDGTGGGTFAAWYDDLIIASKPVYTVQ